MKCPKCNGNNLFDVVIGRILSCPDCGQMIHIKDGVEYD